MSDVGRMLFEPGDPGKNPFEFEQPASPPHDTKEDRHPSGERFLQILQENAELHRKKSRDYGTDSDPFYNIRQTENWCCPNCHEPIPAWLGALIRLSDKIFRLKAYTRNGSLANEGVEDSLRDMGVYASIAQVLFEEAQLPDEPPPAEPDKFHSL